MTTGYRDNNGDDLDTILVPGTKVTTVGTPGSDDNVPSEQAVRELVDALPGGTGDMLGANNLSDVASAETSRANLGVPSIAEAGTPQIGWAEAADTSSPGTGPMRAVAYGDGVFLLGDWSSPQIYYSTDGIEWVLGTGTGSLDVMDVAYGNGKFIAVGSIAGGAQMCFESSNRGQTWTDNGLNSGQSFRSIEYGGGVWVICGDAATVRRSDDDGATWTSHSLPGPNPSHEERSLAYCEASGLFIAGGRDDLVGDQKVWTSPDGQTWTARTIPGYADDWICGQIAVNGLRVMIGSTDINSQNVMAVSDDGGLTWTTNTFISNPSIGKISALAYGNGLWVAGHDGGGSYAMAVSYDNGDSWEPLKKAGGTVYRIAYGRGKFMCGRTGTTSYVFQTYKAEV